MRFIRLIAVATSLGIVGCTWVNPEAEPLDSQLDAWVQQQEYEKALDTLAHVDPKHPDYASLSAKRKTIEVQAERYARKVVSVAQQLVIKGQWAAALDRYDEALEHYASSTTLRDGLGALHQQQRQEVAKRRLLELRHEGEWLADNLPLYQQISRILPRDKQAARELRQLEQRAENVAQQLASEGMAAIEAGDEKRASSLLPLAFRLSDSETLSDARQAYERHRRALERKARLRAKKGRQQTEQKQREIHRLESGYQQALGKEDYLKARRILVELQKLSPDDKSLAKHQTALEKRIDTAVEQHFDAGTTAYSRGKFEQAREHWWKVIALRPDHSLARENLERVGRVLENLQRLREKQ